MIVRVTAVQSHTMPGTRSWQ